MKASARRFLFVPMCLGALTSCTSPPNDTASECTNASRGVIEISEVMVSPKKSAGEWVEMRNGSRSAVELSGLTLWARDADGGRVAEHLLLSGTVDGGGYFVVGDGRTTGFSPPWFDGVYRGAILNLATRGGSIGLRCGDATIAEFGWDASVVSGRSRLNAQPPCDAPLTSMYDGTNAGSPGQPNPPCPLVLREGQCIERDAGRWPVPPAKGDLLVSEVMADPSTVTDAKGEFLELRVVKAADLNGVVVAIGSKEATLNSDECLRVAAGTHLVFAPERDAGLNGGIEQVDFEMALGLSNSGGTVSLKAPDGGLIDEITYAKASKGRSWQRARSTAASSTAPPVWCLTPTAEANLLIDGDYGTPGRSNPPCP